MTSSTPQVSLFGDAILPAMHLGVIDGSVLASAPGLRERFTSAKPFSHLVIDGFFTSDFAQRLVEQFPAPDEGRSRNRYGAAGEKAFRRDLTSLGSAYQSAHDFFGSAEFLSWMSELTGVRDLLYDETNYGGGTHENFEGRDLRPHVDFNFHPVTRLHRRINLIVYLNEGWQPEWGGSIALHSDPRDSLDEVVEYAPIFNRCIIFETSERSWHGFEKITLPADQKHRSRKSLSIYLYTRERPEEQIHGEHTTFFVPRALPPRFVAGHTLSEADANELGELVGQRDRLIEIYQQALSRKEDASAEAARLRILVADLLAQEQRAAEKQT